MAEFWRRWCLLAGLCAGVCLFHYAALGTYASLERADFDRRAAESVTAWACVPR